MCRLPGVFHRYFEPGQCTSKVENRCFISRKLGSMTNICHIWLTAAVFLVKFSSYFFSTNKENQHFTFQLLCIWPLTAKFKCHGIRIFYLDAKSKCSEMQFLSKNPRTFTAAKFWSEIMKISCKISIFVKDCSWNFH